jgi:hypothetical protein
MAHTAMEFTFVEFDNNWTSGGTVQYFATTTAQVIVVAEGATGTKTTYWFKVPKGAVVWITYTENLIFIPAKCVRRAPGDLTSCGRG